MEHVTTIILMKYGGVSRVSQFGNTNKQICLQQRMSFSLAFRAAINTYDRRGVAPTNSSGVKLHTEMDKKLFQEDKKKMNKRFLK